MATFRKGSLKLAIDSLKVAKARSFLTMLGIVVGVMAVICIVSIGAGIRQQVDKQIDHFGEDLITIRPSVDRSGLGGSLLVGSGLPSTASTLLTSADMQTIQHTSGVRFAVPLSIVTGSATGDHAVNAPLVIATSQELPTVINQKIAYGGFFNQNDAANEVVLGKNIATKLFDSQVPLGQTVTFRGQQFIVEGVFDQFDGTPFSLSADFNNAIFMPYSQASSLTGSGLGIYQILVKPTDPKDSANTARAIESRLARAHGGALDSSVLTRNENLVASDKIVHLLTLLIMGVAGVALIVGGVGIMDVMLVSVTERMHEIGIRKAIGASNQQIMRQFLAEALVLSTTGAFIGALLSLGTIGMLRLFTSLQPVPVWQVFVIAPVIAIIIGIIFGTAPALKAARKDPIEALRHE